MNKIFLLFGASGYLGQSAIKYFLDQNYEKYYFFTRKNLRQISTNKNYEVIKVDDLTIEKNVEEAFSKVEVNKESYVFLFNTIGGYWGGKKIWETPFEEFQKLLNVNLNTSFLIAKYFMILAQQTKGGSICFTGAYSSLIHEPNIAAYGISKSALNYLVKSLSVESKGINITANLVAPYIIDTPENRKWLKDETKLIPTEKICSVVQKIFDEWKIFNGNIISLFDLIEK